MKKFELFAATALAMTFAQPAWAQSAPPPAPAPAPAPADTAAAEPDVTEGEVVVTAQRRAETLQSVPIAVSAFTAAALDRQQIKTTSDLQLTLPNITFTKSNFTSSSSFNIRGIGDLCVGVTCDAATAVHVNDVPVLGSPIFQNEYFDMERIEVLRGPQGTLYGRNATGGVINFITARPDLNAFHAAGEAEYGNYDSIRVKGMVNVPLGDVAGVRLAGYYLNRDGFTRNLFNNKRIDGRDQYDIRGSLRFQPSSSTTIDIVGHYFHEDDDRSRIQKQLCHRDPTGVLGCLPDRLATEQVNGDSTLAAVLTSREFLSAALGALGPTFRPLGLGSVYNTDGDVYSAYTNPAGRRTVNIDSPPHYRTVEKQVLVNISQDLGSRFNLKLDGGYTEGSTDSTVDYNVGIERSLANNTGLTTLATYAALPGAAFPGGVNPFTPIAQTLIPSGAAGPFCQSLAEYTRTGVYGGHRVCANTSLDFDRSTARGHQWFGEGVFTSKLDGPFNFLLGGGYLDYTVRDNEYFVNSFALDYAAGLLGAASSIGARVGPPANAAFPNVYRASPFYDSDSRFYHLKSYGLFGEVYGDISDSLKLTLGLRYNHDRKNYSARTTLFNDANGTGILVPYGATDITQALNYASIDFDTSLAGNQPFANNKVSFGRLTGRGVIDWKITSRNLLYASYARGYKSGGINPPLSPVFAVPGTFGPETVNAFEIGSKNTFVDGKLLFNLTGFYYQYKQLQLSRIVARTSVNDNVDANIYGLEAETVIRPTPALSLNLNASYLHTKIVKDKLLGNPQDPSGGRADAVIIKDITNGSNCAVVSNAGVAAQSNGFVNAVNAGINAATAAGLQGTTAIPGTNTTGAFSICSSLTAAAANPAAGVTVLASGVPVNIRGNELPQSPHYKFSAGLQYAFRFDDWNLTPRIDYAYTGGYYGSVFNGNVNRIRSYGVVNAQLQLNAPDDRFYVRAFVQNLTKNNAITGLYVTDQSSGLFTNAFTLEPRRYGLTGGFKF